MNSDTHTKVAALSCGHDHEVRLVEADGSLFLENDAVEFYRLKRDEKRPVEERVYFLGSEQEACQGSHDGG